MTVVLLSILNTKTHLQAGMSAQWLARFPAEQLVVCCFLLEAACVSSSPLFLPIKKKKKKTWVLKSTQYNLIPGSALGSKRDRRDIDYITRRVIIGICREGKLLGHPNQ